MTSGEEAPDRSQDSSLVGHPGTVFSSAYPLDGSGCGLYAGKALEDLSQAILTSSSIGIYIVQDGCFRIVNPKFQQIVGYTEDELLGRNSFAFVFPDDRPAVRENAIRMLKGHAATPYEYRYLHKNGDRRWVMESVAPVVYERKRATLGHFVDITDRKHVEQALRDSEDRYRTLFSESRDAIWVVTKNGHIVDANDSAAILFGYSSGELPGRNIWDSYVDPEERDSFQREMEQKGHVRDFPSKLRRRDGTVIDCLLTATGWRSRDTIIGYQGIVRNVTEQKRSELALAESERRYRILAENVTDVIWLSDMTLRSTYVSPSVYKLLGYSAEEVMEQPFRGLMTAESHEVFRELMLRRREESANEGNGEDWVVEVEMVRKDGSSLWTEHHGKLLRSEDGEAVGVLRVVRDIHARKSVEEELKASEQRFRALIENSQDMILVADDQGCIKYASPSVKRISGYRPENLAGRSIYSSIDPQDLAAAKKDFKKLTRNPGMTRAFEFRNRRKDGSWQTIEALSENLINHAAVGGIVVNCRDISQRKQIEEELRNLSHKLVETQESERRRVARELHDEVGQALTALNLILAEVRSLPQASDRLLKAEEIVSDLVEKIHDISLDLRPAMLDDLGLLPALLWHFDRYTTHTCIRVLFKHNGLQGRRFRQELETTAYRTVQESLTNVARHARVSEVRVRILASKALMTLEVEDDGVGFDMDHCHDRKAGGLLGMRERTSLLGGHLNVESAPGVGTRLMAELPLDRAE